MNEYKFTVNKVNYYHYLNSLLKRKAPTPDVTHISYIIIGIFIKYQRIHLLPTLLKLPSTDRFNYKTKKILVTCQFMFQEFHASNI